MCKTPVDYSSLIALVVAFFTAVGLIWQTRLMTLNMRAETLLNLEKEWRSETILRLRSSASETLLDKRKTGATPQKLYESPGSEIDDLLDYLDTIAYFFRRRVLHRNLVGNRFYWWMELYWIACIDYVPVVRGYEGASTWKNLESELTKLRKLNSPNEQPTERQIPDFLKTEAALYPRRIRDVAADD